MIKMDVRDKFYCPNCEVYFNCVPSDSDIVEKKCEMCEEDGMEKKI